MACIRKRRGQWVTDYRDGGGVRRWRTFATKRDAEDFLAKTIPEVRQRKRTVVPVTMTVAAYAERWISLITNTVKPRTLESYASTLRLHLLPVFGAWRVQHLDKGASKPCLPTNWRVGSPVTPSASSMQLAGDVAGRGG